MRSFLFTLILAGCSFAAVTGIQVTGTTATLFPGADQDTRPGNTANGNTRAFVIGKRSAEKAADDRYYSRALQTNTAYYGKIACGADTALFNFQTADIPLGIGYTDPWPADPGAPGVWAAPASPGSVGRQRFLGLSARSAWAGAHRRSGVFRRPRRAAALDRGGYGNPAFRTRTLAMHTLAMLLFQTILTLQPGQSVTVQRQASNPGPSALLQPASAGLPTPAGIVAPKLPQAWTNIAYPTVTGTSWPVHAGGDFQAAMNNANCGDEIVLDAGVTWSSNYTVPLKACAAKPILVRSSAIASLPPGVQVKQAQASLMPAILTPNTGSVLNFAASTAGWYFAGIRFTAAKNVVGMWNLITLSVNATTVAQLPQSIVFDRVLVHGNNQQCIRGILADAAGFALINSQVYGFYAVGQDSQAVIAYNSPGPYVLLNNYLEAAGENIMFGGGTTTIPGVIPSDATIRLNLLSKQFSAWNRQPAPCGGSGQPMCYDVKNNFEVKNGQRILFDSNISQYAWAQGQGLCWIVNTPAPWGLTALDLTYTNNVCQHASQVFSFNGITTAQSARLLLMNNVGTDINPAIYGGTPSSQVQGPDANWTIAHNTIVVTPTAATVGAGSVFFGDAAPNTESAFTMVNNLFYGPIGANSASPGMALAAFPVGNNLSYNVFVGDVWPNGCYPCNPVQPGPYPASAHFFEATSTATPTGASAPCNYSVGESLACTALDYALVQFVDYAGGSAGTNLAGLALQPTSPYAKAASDGADMGANIPALQAAIASIPLTQ